MATPPTPDQPSRLLNLPPEIREHIYSLILHPHYNKSQDSDGYTTYAFADALVLFGINKQIYNESHKIFYDLNVFARVETPWPQSKDHLHFEGDVRIVMKDARAEKFENHRMVLGIDAPSYERLDLERERYVVHADDLDKFAKTWFYANLSHPSLNQNLRLTLRLCDPFSPSWEEPHMPRALQRRLLLPWGMVKNLQEMRIEGNLKPFSSIEKEMRAAQLEPVESAEHCLEECTRFKQLGNTELKAGNYKAALDFYTKAWHAIHVVIRGRQRHVHGDAFFHKKLTEPPYAGKSGPAERLVLRVQLVANTCLAYLKLEDYEECKFWGMRTINTIREALGVGPEQDMSPQDEAETNFPASQEMGRVYYRTALACKAMDDKPAARRLLNVAKIYLPSDADQKAVNEALRGCMLRIG